MLWIFIAIVSYFFLALVELIDKRILSYPKSSPLAYAFYTGVLTSLSLILWPFDFRFLSVLSTFYAFLAGISFFGAIYFLYGAIIKGEVSRVVSIIGGFSPIVIFILSLLFLDEKFHKYSVAAILMLVTGSVILSFVRDGNKFKFGKHFFLSSFAAAFLFALSYFLTKVVFLRTSFLNGFIWVRMGTLICVFAVMSVPSLRGSIGASYRGFSKKLTALFVANKAVSALAHIALNYAIGLGSVAIVNALQAVQYAFIFFLTLFFSCFFPRFLHEVSSPKTLVLKIIGISLVSGGVMFLFVGA